VAEIKLTPSRVSSKNLKPGGRLRALSIRQLWGSAILLGGKDVENRSRRWAYRWLLVHASLKLDRKALRDPRILALSLVPQELVVGSLLGIVEVVGCVCGWCSPWSDAHSFQLVLKSPLPLLHPVSYRGRLGLFDVPIELLRDVVPAGFETAPPPISTRGRRSSSDDLERSSSQAPVRTL